MNQPNVGQYTIHGWYGIGTNQKRSNMTPCSFGIYTLGVLHMYVHSQYKHVVPRSSFTWRTQILAVSPMPLNFWLTSQLQSSYTVTPKLERFWDIPDCWMKNYGFSLSRRLPSSRTSVSFSKRRSLNGTRSDVERVRSRLALERIVRSFDCVGWGKRGTGGFFSTWTRHESTKNRVRHESKNVNNYGDHICKWMYNMHMSNGLNLLHPWKDMAEMVIAFCVSLIVPGDLMCAIKSVKHVYQKSAFFCVTPIVPESVMIVSGINVLA